jgi:hypothetical protein
LEKRPQAKFNGKEGKKEMASLRQQVDDLQQILDEVESTLEDAYQPETTREDLAAAVGEALSIISPGDSEEDDQGSDETDDEAE